MEKNFIVKILFALAVVICIKNSAGDETMRLIRYLWQQRHWNEMTWLDTIKGVPFKKNARMDVEAKNQLWTLTNISFVAKIKIISLLMQCGYGKELIDFLWISAYTVSQCNELSNDRDGTAEDCWQKFVDSLKTGAVITYKLWAMNEQLRILHQRVMPLGEYEVSEYYKMLAHVNEFLKQAEPGRTAIAFAILYEGIKHLATSVENEWNRTCQPSYSVIGQEVLNDEYERLPLDLNETPKLLYDFYVDRLNATVDSIKSHTEKIGFQCTPPWKVVTFSVPTETDGSSSSHQ